MNNARNNLDTLITLKEACSVLGVHPNTLRRWDKKGILPAVRYGERKDRHYRKDDIRKFISQDQPNVSGVIQENEILGSVYDRSPLGIASMLTKIIDAASEFFMQSSPESTYESIIHGVKRLLSADHGSIFLMQDNELRRIFTTYPVLNKIQPRKVGTTYTTFEVNKPNMTIVPDKNFPHPLLNRLGMKTVINIPLHYSGHTIGVINMLSHSRLRYRDEEMSLFSLYGTLASIAIKKIQEHVRFTNEIDNHKLFLSIASHEIRNPLSVVNSLAQLLQYQEAGDSANYQVYQKIVQELKRLNVVIDEFLLTDVNNLAMQSIEVSQCSLHELVAESISNFALQFPSHRVQFNNKIQGDALVSCDRYKLVQVLTNILNNAGKYSPLDSEVLVTLLGDEHYYKISIRDYGQGISKKDQKHIFDRYYRARGKEQAGMGIGLYLAKSIIDKHHGAIQVKSEVEKGTTVVISLPKNFDEK